MSNATPAAGAALHLDFVREGLARVTFDQPGSKVNTLNSGLLAEFDLKDIEAMVAPRPVKRN